MSNQNFNPTASIQTKELLAQIFVQSAQLASALLHVFGRSLNVERWWDDNVVCTCGQCDMDKVTPVLNIMKECVVKYFELATRDRAELTFAEIDIAIPDELLHKWIMQLNEFLNNEQSYILSRSLLANMSNN